MSLEVSLEEHRLPWESDDQWNLRKSFLLRHYDKYESINRLICLSQIYINVEFLGCTYNKKVMEEVVSLAQGLGDERREERKRIIQKTFVRGGELSQQKDSQRDPRQMIKPHNPFVAPATKKSRPTELSDSPKSPLVLKKEKLFLAIRAAVKIASDPASKKLSRQPVPESAMELLNYVCGREKVAWKLEFAERDDKIMEYYLCVDDVLVAHQFCGSKKEAQESGSKIAIKRLNAVNMEIREEKFCNGKISLALFTCKDKVEEWETPDVELFSIFHEKLYKMFDQLTSGLETDSQMSKFEKLECLCEDAGLALETETAQKAGWKQDFIASAGGLVIGLVQLQGKQLTPGSEAENRETLAGNVFENLTMKNHRLFEDDNGRIMLKASDKTDAPFVEKECDTLLDTCEECSNGTCSVTPQLISRFIVRCRSSEASSLENPKAVLVQSAQFCGVPFAFDHGVDSKNNKWATVSLWETVVAESSGVFSSQKEAEQDACIRILDKLKKHCFTIVQKTTIDPNQEEIGTDLSDVSVNEPSRKSKMAGNIGLKLMEKMGWAGGGIGKQEQGIKEPISVQEVFAREGLGRAAACGMGKQFTKAIETILREYIASPKQDDLVFASDFSNEQRKLIHTTCRRMNLKSTSYGKDEDRKLTVQKKRTAQELLLMLISNGGENGKFMVIPPSVMMSPW